jgi:hypothetical protein
MWSVAAVSFHGSQGSSGHRSIAPVDDELVMIMRVLSLVQALAKSLLEVASSLGATHHNSHEGGDIAERT